MLSEFGWVPIEGGSVSIGEFGIPVRIGEGSSIGDRFIVKFGGGPAMITGVWGGGGLPTTIAIGV